MPPYTIGLDFGTNSCRSLIVDVESGRELGSSVFPYPSGTDGVIVDPRDPNLARQNPADYLLGIEATVRQGMEAAKGVDPSFSPDRVIGIGVDTTGSSPMPIGEWGEALCFQERFQNDSAAMVWLWRDHTIYKEATQITELAAEMRPEYLAKVGGVYSSEWWWSKMLHCRHVAEPVFDAAASWAEICDWIPAMLTGQTSPAGTLSPEWADRLGLPSTVMVAVGAFDAHMGAVVAGIAPGTLVKIIGTSTCDIMIHPNDLPLADIPGVCGIVDGSVAPGFYGIEAGQSGVGDIFLWFVNNLVPETCGSTVDEKSATLQYAAGALAPGESGLLALDWNNGNRTILVDARLTGLLIGQTLRTQPAEIYRALLEATGFGALAIIDRIEEYGVPVKEVVNCGGLAVKNELLMRVYADITGRPMKVSRSEQTPALGAAIFAAVAAGEASGGMGQSLKHSIGW